MSENSKMTVGSWLITFLVVSIPLVGIIMLFVWAFGGSTNPGKANWAKAALILTAIAAVLYGTVMGIILNAYPGIF